MTVLSLQTGKQIQKVSNYSVYLATVGGFIANTPNPAQLPGAIKDAISLLHKAGLNTASPVFMGAHSLGGECFSLGNILIGSHLCFGHCFLGNFFVFRVFRVCFLIIGV